MKKTNSIIMVLLTTIMALAATTAQANETMTITLKNGQVITRNIIAGTGCDSVRFVGGDYGSATGVGVKYYPLNSNGVSEDYLYSQMNSLEIVSDVVPGAPVITPGSGTVYATTAITITADTGAAIYYTTDGTAPTTASTQYTGPFTLSAANNATVTVKAIAVKNGNTSAVTTASFTFSTEVDNDNNVNANWKETSYNIPQTSANATSSSATYGMAWRLEYPHINTSSNSTVIVHASSDYGISYSLELDKSQRANRWSCFTMHAGTPDNNVGRSKSSFSTETCVESSYRVNTEEYSSGKYTTNTTNDDGSNTTLLSRGHVCSSDDRQSSTNQNGFTFITSNCHPQYQAQNGGIWGNMEKQVIAWGNSSSFRDTLYVCKGATIADVTLNGATSSGTIPNSEIKTKYGVTITGTLTIPRYWYMAVLCLKNGQYRAMAYWLEHKNSAQSSTAISSCMISIDELERRTGIDFFCNLPDDIETTVEAETPSTSYWK